MVVSQKLQGDLNSNSGVPLASFLVFQYKKNLTTSLLTAACLIKDSDVSNVSPGWWLVAVAQEQTPSCFLCPTDCQAASCDFPSQVTQVIMLLEAWGDCELSGDANSVAMSGRLDFPRQACSPVTQTCLGEIEVVGDGSPRVLSTSVGTYSRTWSPGCNTTTHRRPKANSWRGQLPHSCFWADWWKFWLMIVHGRD